MRGAASTDAEEKNDSLSKRFSNEPSTAYNELLTLSEQTGLFVRAQDGFLS